MVIGEIIQHKAHRISDGIERSVMEVSREPKRLCGLIKRYFGPSPPPGQTIRYFLIESD
jgi:hypothetical protein